MGFNKRKISTEATSGYQLFDAVKYTGVLNTEVTFNLTPDFLLIDPNLAYTEDTVYDTVRGNSQAFRLDRNYASSNVSLTFTANGFISGSYINGAYNYEYVAYALKAGGSASSNTNGSVTSTVSANVNGGFSIVKYQSTSSSMTVGHGLSQSPEMIWVKGIDIPYTHAIYHTAIGNGSYLDFTSSAGATTSSAWNNTNPTNSVFSLGAVAPTNDSTYPGFNYIAYCFHSVPGLSKIGSYTYAVGSGYKVTTGFTPKFLMVKGTSNSIKWHIWDSLRDTTSPHSIHSAFPPNNSGDSWLGSAEVEFVSDGFYFTSSNANYSVGDTFMYIAFADESI